MPRAVHSWALHKHRMPSRLVMSKRQVGCPQADPLTGTRSGYCAASGRLERRTAKRSITDTRRRQLEPRADGVS